MLAALHPFFLVLAWLIPAYGLGVIGMQVEEPPPPNNRPITLLSVDQVTDEELEQLALEAEAIVAMEALVKDVLTQ